MRMSNWSSDVCSSDLWRGRVTAHHADRPSARLFAELYLSRAGDELSIRLHIRHFAKDQTGADVPRRRSHPICRRRACHLFAACGGGSLQAEPLHRSEEHTSELQSLMRISYAVFCLKKKTNKRKLP